MTTVAKNMIVGFRIRFTYRDSGEVAHDSFTDEYPYEYLHGGYKNVIPAIEAACEGKSVGDKFTFEVTPENGFKEVTGETQTSPRSYFPTDIPIYAGRHFLVEGPDGDTMTLWITEVTPDTVTVTKDHPLAGEYLNAECEICFIRNPSAAELEHGHPHITAPESEVA